MEGLSRSRQNKRYINYVRYCLAKTNLIGGVDKVSKVGRRGDSLSCSGILSFISHYGSTLYSSSIVLEL